MYKTDTKETNRLKATTFVITKLTEQYLYGDQK